MWNKQPVRGNYEFIEWLTPMKLTKEGEEHLINSRPRKVRKNLNKAVFVGFTKNGSYKILLKNTSAPYIYSRDLWEILPIKK